VPDDKGFSERIPILKMGEFLLVTIQVEMHDRLVTNLQDELTEAIVAHQARGVLIDISALEVVDSFIGRAEAMGAWALVVTLDTTMLGWRPQDLNRGSLPFARLKRTWRSVIPRRRKLRSNACRRRTRTTHLR